MTPFSLLAYINLFTVFLYFNFFFFLWCFSNVNLINKLSYRCVCRPRQAPPLPLCFENFLTSKKKKQQKTQLINFAALCRRPSPSLAAALCQHPLRAAIIFFFLRFFFFVVTSWIAIDIQNTWSTRPSVPQSATCFSWPPSPLCTPLKRTRLASCPIRVVSFLVLYLFVSCIASFVLFYLETNLQLLHFVFCFGFRFGYRNLIENFCTAAPPFVTF